MFLYDKTNILEGSGIFEVDFAPSHGPASEQYTQYTYTKYCHKPFIVYSGSRDKDTIVTNSTEI